MVVTLTELKEQLQINDDVDYNDEDNYLLAILEVAEDSVFAYIQQTEEEVTSANDGKLPSPIKHAVKLMAAQLYISREPVTFGVTGVEVPLSYKYLLCPYLKY